jgi:hypothetical protein
MRNAHPEPYQVTRRGLGLRASKHKIELPLQHIEIFILIRMDVRRHESARR